MGVTGDWSPPSLSVAVMAHPKREAMVADLVDRLDRPTVVAWDRCGDRYDTGGRALDAADRSCTHHLVVQDDVVPCRDLVAGAERALRWTPQDVPVSLYVGRVRPFRQRVERAVARADGASWITMAGIYWGPAVIVPTAVIDDVLEWWPTAEVANYDRRLSRWFEERRLACWYTWPSLVEHRGDESLVTGHTAGRRAHRFAGDGVSALELDWSGRVVDVPGADRLDHGRQQLAAARRR